MIRTVAMSLLAASAVADTHMRIVITKERAVLEYEGGTAGFEATVPEAGRRLVPSEQKVQKYAQYLKEKTRKLAASVGAHEVYNYCYTTVGFSAELTDEQAAVLEHSEEVVAVFDDELLEYETDTTPRYTGVSGRGQAWMNGYTGDTVVIGIVDGGIMPEHPSFADVPTARRAAWDLRKTPYGPPPATFTGTGCNFGNTSFNTDDRPFLCNNKIVKAQAFAEGYLRRSNRELVETEFYSARDSSGHGTHVAGIAAGNYGVQAEVNGTVLGEGLLSGIAPRARIAVYKACWEGNVSRGCSNSDTTAALEQAVEDGVDVINHSIGSSKGTPTFARGFGFLAAVRNNVWATCSAGNSGPDPESLSFPGAVPWVTGVANMQDDQVYRASTLVEEPAGEFQPMLHVESTSSVQLDDTGDIVGELALAEPLDACDVDMLNGTMGRIAFIQRGGCSFKSKFAAAEEGGAIAVIVFNNRAGISRMSASTAEVPGVMVSKVEGQKVALALAAGTNVTVRMSADANSQRTDRVHTSSARGPNRGAYDIIKPDISAPGVRILAAGTTETNENQDEGAMFEFKTGTSMAAPHVAGMYALLREAHPEWSHAMARSALMTTARTGLQATDTNEAATPFDVGAGAADPVAMYNPGLVYDITWHHYIAFQCAFPRSWASERGCGMLQERGYSFEPLDLNMPSIGVAELNRSVVVTRTVTSVNDVESRFRVEVQAPKGIDVEFFPSELVLKPSEAVSFNITLTVEEDAELGEWVFGEFVWKRIALDSNDDVCHQQMVRSNIAVRPVAVDSDTPVPATAAPPTQAPETQAPETQAPETPAPSDDDDDERPCLGFLKYFACGQCWLGYRHAINGGCYSPPCPAHLPFRACRKCWVDEDEAQSRGCCPRTKSSYY